MGTENISPRKRNNYEVTENVLSYGEYTREENAESKTNLEENSKTVILMLYYCCPNLITIVKSEKGIVTVCPLRFPR